MLLGSLGGSLGKRDDIKLLKPPGAPLLSHSDKCLGMDASGECNKEQDSARKAQAYHSCTNIPISDMSAKMDVLGRHNRRLQQYLDTVPGLEMAPNRPISHVDSPLLHPPCSTSPAGTIPSIHLLSFAILVSLPEPHVFACQVVADRDRIPGCLQRVRTSQGAPMRTGSLT